MTYDLSILSLIRSMAAWGLVAVAAAPPALAQATSRPCTPGKDEQPGPACLMAHQPLGALPEGAVYWQLQTYPDLAAARHDRPAHGVVTFAFGQTWLFTIGPRGVRPRHGTRIAEIGPIPVKSGASFDAEFLKSTFSPGMTAPVHVHSGPEAFYAIAGDTCLETPDGVQFARGPGNRLVIQGGPPMLLMAPGPALRKGFALILHDSALPPTTLVHHWTPKGLCGSTSTGTGGP